MFRRRAAAGTDQDPAAQPQHPPLQAAAGPPGSQATADLEYSSEVHAVLRIRDVYPGSRIRVLSRIPDLGSRIPKNMGR